ncbi:hypothetical protein PG995_003406 [Apiospora arundinis]|uniref:Uncharacterized protein n=1 Tax=Apiospora arundinis TaxID=335852 RepID=A0ABR2HSK1_9PEZI
MVDISLFRPGHKLLSMEQQHQQTSKAKKTEREELGIQQIQRFLKEPARDGNPLMALPSGTTDAAAAEREAEARMRSNIQGIMKPFLG